ncbi:T9SS type A sorting domain-containing protein [Tamlana fucoidanivorans]|uniref:T9SS type A sorting domain-containing protein n=1 Tax=Allotamlana fucoidanivorans TaxID=2583814 RepID=A0A5C4SHF4_9FLAO|nr:T9SS type A sorting domain-containing protein [Tamlana fucoidanivorans]TNJ43148.1 T9SS type A sorting domain-containing protein [Tamlana fucoidanivorans]
MKHKTIKVEAKFLYLGVFSLLLFFNLSAYGQYGGGSGTSEDPYLIETSDQLVTLSNTSSHWGKHFELIQDIDMSGKTYSPVGTASNPFTGSFNGLKHSISNLTITAPSDELDGTGMFGVVSGQIQNLGIVNVYGNYTGTAFSNWTRAGVFVGILQAGGSVTKCYSQGGSFTVSGGWTGGIVGVLFAGGVTNTVEDCYSSTSVSGSYGCGGIVGLNRGEHIINRVAFYGTVSGGNAIVSIQNDPTNAQKNGIPATNAFYKASLSSDNGAVGLSESELLIESNYTTFDFSSTWQIDNSLGHAILSNVIPEPSFFEIIRNQRVASESSVKWINFAPGTSGYCEEFWCHPTDADVMFSGPDMHAAFGTWDGGQSWQTINDSDGNGFEMRRIIDIQFSLQNPDYGIAFANDQSGSSTSGRLYETQDRGRTWSVISVMGKCHSKLSIHPTNDNVWFLGAGDFWNVKSNHRSAANPGGIKQSRSDYGYVWKTTDKGVTWKKVATGISSDLDVGRIIFDRNNPNNMIMATSHGMFRSTDLGETWSSSATGLPNDRPRDLTSYYNSNTNEFILYAVDQTFYAANSSTINSTGGVFKSTDGGLSWQSITGNLALNMQSITDFTTRDSYHRTVANWLGISKSDSKSVYTTYPSSILPTFNRIVVNPTNKNEIYLVHNKRHTFSFGPGDVWKTEDGGTSWIACSRSGLYWINETDKAYWQSRNNPLGANIDFSHMQRYMDEGREESSAARMLAITMNGDVFTGINQQLLKSNNGGDSWEQADDYETNPGSNAWVGRGNTNLPGRQLILETGVSGRKLLLSGEHGLWQTTSLGSHPNPDAVAIQQIEGQIYDNGAHSIATAAVHPNNPNMIYMLMWRQEHRGKLRRTSNGGDSWSNIATIFEGSNNSWESVAYQNSLLIDPITPHNMYFCATRKAVSEVGGSVDESILTKGSYGIYKSSDAGFNWGLADLGLPANCSVRRLTMDPSNPNIIYASLNQFGNNDPGGLYKTTNGASTWSQVSIPSEIKSVNNFFIDRNTGSMFISAGSRSGTLNAGGVWKSEDEGTSWIRIFEAPYVWQTEVSPANPNIILVSVAAQVPSMLNEFKNPGAYISIDAGETWKKINQGLAHPDRIVDLKPDPVDETLIWSAGWGSGWYKAKIDLDVLSLQSDKKVDKRKVKLYPNPVNNGILNFKGVELLANYSKFTIVDVMGKVVRNGILEEPSINVSGLQSGMYVVVISSGEETNSYKVLINNL